MTCRGFTCARRGFEPRGMQAGLRLLCKLPLAPVVLAGSGSGCGALVGCCHLSQSDGNTKLVLFWG